MIETWLNLFGLLSGAFLLIDFQLQAPALHGDSHEKWIKETGLDISAGWRAEDMARRKTPAGRIARKLKRTEGATRQKAFSMGLSLDSR
jgi:hypothetical protein